MSAPVVLITGALTGIGAATAVAFAVEGANVVISGRHRDEGEALASDLKEKGAPGALFVKTDVRDESEVSALIDHAIARFGRLDVAVNNAGKEALGSIVDFTEQSYNDVFGTNVLGMLLSLKHEFRAMQKQGAGSIINVGSVYGHKGFGGGGSVYAGSKFAVEGITKCAALEGAPLGIRVNAIAPGHVDTAMFARVIGGNFELKAAVSRMIPLGRVGSPKEIAQTIAFIASNRSSFMTGEIVTVDGGLAAS